VRVALIYPPDLAPPTMPFAALPLFNACLKRAGHEVLVMDLNAESFSVMIREENLARYGAALDRLTSALENKTARSPQEEQEYEAYRFLHLFPRQVIEGATDAVRELQSAEAFYDPVRYRHARRVIGTAHAFLNATTPRLDPRNSNFTNDLYLHLSDDQLDPYAEVYLAHTIPRLQEFRIQLIAMSCPFSQQLGTAMRFAKLVRRMLPNVRILLGGTGVADAQHVLLTSPLTFDYIDYAIVGDGEEALIELIGAIEGRLPFDDVAGLWRREGQEVVRPARFHNVDMDSNPVPDYRGIDFGQYMLPEPAILYTTSRGCYYGKCTFCPESFRITFRMRSPEKVYEDVRNLVLHQGVRNIHFFDPLTPPRTLAHVSRQVARENLPLNYHAEVKFEKIYTSPEFVKTLSEGGCKLLQFGLESGVQRVLDAMKKGNRLDQIEIMLENLSRNGIKVAVSWFVGFPTESEDDARETWRLIRRHRGEMHYSLYTGTFGLGHDVPVFQHPEDYGIDLTFDGAGNPSYVRRDGADWDHQKLHPGFHVRSDVALGVSGAALLYAASRPDLIPQLRGVHAIGPVSWEDPPIPQRRASVPVENGCVELGRGPDGRRRYKVYVAQMGESFDADEIDVELLKLIGTRGRQLSEILEDERAPADVLCRLGAFIDKGFVESTDSVPAALTAE
jgi:anaerobic magnesium-protoporphyrin IX monomethyl ester cyclase